MVKITAIHTNYHASVLRDLDLDLSSRASQREISALCDVHEFPVLGLQLYAEGVSYRVHTVIVRGCPCVGTIITWFLGKMAKN